MHLRPWMDIPRARELGGPRSLSSQRLDVAWRDLLRTIEAYHAIRKDSLPRFRSRITMLERRIKPKAEFLINEMSRRSFDVVLPGGSLLGVLNTYVRQQSHAKAEYLRVLFTHFSREQGEVQNPRRLVDELKQHQFRPAPPLPGGTKPSAPSKGWVRAQPSSKLTEMTGRVAFERVDPYHRTGAEVSFVNEQITIKNPEQQQLLAHLISWIERLDQGYKQPFMVYLEVTSHCMGYDKTMGHEGLGVTRVQYQTSGPPPPSGTFGLLSFTDDGTVMEMLGGQTRPFDTFSLGNKVLPGKGVGALKAYAWTSTGEIVTGIHRHGRVHHSSVGDGKPVRCAGMIGAIKGKIRFLNNDSGHYHPTGKQLWQLAKHLEGLGVLHKDFELDEAASRRTLKLAALQQPAPDWIRGVRGITLGGHRRGKS